VTALQIVLPALVAFAVTAVATPMISRLAVALGVVDRPNQRKVNRRPNIPLMGGLAVALGLLVGLSVANLLAAQALGLRAPMEGFVVGASLLLLVGAVDDRWTLSALPKLSVEILAAGAAIYAGYQIDYVTEPFSGRTLWLPMWLSWLVTALWIVGITNAINFMDGLDGLATGIGAIIATTLTIIAWRADQSIGVVFGVVLVSALLGFLPFNFSPSRIMLGDTGALFLGYSLSLLALESYRQATVLTFLVPLLALAVPIADTGVSVLRRIRAGKHPFAADRGHMHHRLLDFEGSPRNAVLSLYFLTACFCVIAVSFTRLHGAAAILFLAAVIVLTIRLLRNLGMFASQEEAPAPRAERSEELRGNVR
jgi:UDP-GlcNAc:undecaprenyl-phosphate GlcNAc-1-phosphate transferase